MRQEMEPLINLFVDFQKKYAEENMGAFTPEKLDVLKLLFLKLYKQNIEEKVKTSELEVKKNEFGNFEHEGTKLVFLDHPDHGYVAIGKNRNGKILPLTIHDIIVCYNMKWKYSVNHCIGSAKQSHDCAYAVMI